MLVCVPHDGPLEDLAAEWAALFAADPEATPFQSPAWAVAWWRHFGPGLEPFVLTVREDGALVGLAPLVLGGRGPFRVLRGLGAGVGNYWDVIAAPAQRAAVARASAEHLRAEAGRWDLFDVDRFPPGSPTPAALAAAGLRVHDRPSIVAPMLALPPAFDDYLAGLSSNRRGKVRRYLRPLDKGEVEVAFVTEPGEIAAAVAAWQRLRIAWWAARDRAMDPEHASERFLAFTTDVMTALVADGLGIVRRFVREGEVIGVALDFVDATTMYYWLNGFDPAHAKLRLGHGVIAGGIRDAIDRGLVAYDFMVGSEGYKYEYGATDRELGGLIATSGRLRSRAALGARLLRDRLRPPPDPHG